MEKTTFEIIVTIVVTLLSDISSLILVFTGGIQALVSYMPSLYSVALNVFGSNDVLNLGMLNGSCCICIPIPLGLVFFALQQRVKASFVVAPLSQTTSDNK